MDTATLLNQLLTKVLLNDKEKELRTESVTLENKNAQAFKPYPNAIPRPKASINYEHQIPLTYSNQYFPSSPVNYVRKYQNRPTQTLKNQIPLAYRNRNGPFYVPNVAPPRNSVIAQRQPYLNIDANRFIGPQIQQGSNFEQAQTEKPDDEELNGDDIAAYLRIQKILKKINYD